MPNEIPAFFSRFPATTIPWPPSEKCVKFEKHSHPQSVSQVQPGFFIGEALPAHSLPPPPKLDICVDPCAPPISPPEDNNLVQKRKEKRVGFRNVF